MPGSRHEEADSEPVRQRDRNDVAGQDDGADASEGEREGADELDEETGRLSTRTARALGLVRPLPMRDASQVTVW